MVIQHSGGRDFDLPRHFHYSRQGLSLWCFNIVAESTRPGYAESNHESNIFLIPTHYGDITLFYAPGGDSAISD